MKKLFLMAMLISILLVSNAFAAVVGQIKWTDGTPASRTIAYNGSGTINTWVSSDYSQATRSVIVYELDENNNPIGTAGIIQEESLVNIPSEENFNLNSNYYGGAGNFMIELYTIDADQNSRTYDIYLTVNKAAPVFNGPIPNIVMSEGETKTIDLSQYFSDPETNDVLIYTATAVQDINVDISGSVVTISPIDSEFSGNRKVTFTASDGTYQTSSNEVNIIVASVEDSPQVSNIPDQTIQEGGTFTSINLDNYVTDADNSDVEMSWTYSGNNELLISINNRVATITVPNTEWNGQETITFRATDPSGLTGSDSAIFKITSVNDAPIISNIPGQTIQEGGSFTSINLDNYVTDIDNQDSEITWTYSGNNELIVLINNRIATITIPNAEWNGQETITFRATDLPGLFDEDSAIFEVSSVIDAPNAVIDSPLSDANILVGDSVNFQGHGDDVDGTINVYEWNFGDGRISNLQNPGNIQFNTAGTYTVTFNVQDNDNAWDPTPATVGITVNTLPIANDDYVDVEWNSEDNQIDVLANDNDPDGDGLSITSVSEPSHGIVSINNGYVYYTPDSAYLGSDSFDYTIDDNNGGEASATVYITIEVIYLNPTAYFDVDPVSGTIETEFEFDASASSDPNPMLPPWEECVRADLNEDSKVDIFDVLEILKIIKPPVGEGDVNDDGKTNIFDMLAILRMMRNDICSENLHSLKYNWKFGDGVETVGYVLEFDEVTHTYSEPGTYDVELTVINSQGLTDTFVRAVTVQNTQPNAVIDSPASDVNILIGDSVNFQGHGEDTDGTIIAYSWDFGDGRTTTQQNPGDIPFNTAGTYTVTFNVQDNDNDWDPTPATVTVTVEANRAPIVSILSPPSSVSILVGDSVYFHGSAQDPDGDLITTYEWDFGDGRTSNVLIPRTIYYNTEGVYTVTFRAQDEFGLWSGYAMRTITVSTASILEKITLPRQRVHVSQIDFFNDINNIQPGEELLAFIKFTNNDNYDMKKTKVTISIPELGVYRRIGPFNLEKGEETSKTISLQIPYYVQAKEYDVRITISESGSSQRTKHRFIRVR